MNSPEPRLNKLPFIIGDVVLLVTAFLLAKYLPQPLAVETVAIIAALVVIGAALAVVPFIRDYVAQEREASARVRDELELQVKRVQAAAESLGRAAAQIKAIEEAVHKSARDAETLPYRMQEKLAEFNAALAEKENDEHEALERELEDLRAASSDGLKAVAEKIAKATTDWAALEVATRKQLGTAQDAATRLEEKLQAAGAELDRRVAALQAALAAAPAPTSVPVPVVPVADPAPSPTPAAPDVPAAEASAPADPAPAPAAETSASPVAAEVAEAPKPRKPRAPRKPKPEELLQVMSADAPAPAAAPEAPAPSPVEAVQVTVADDPPPAESSASTVEASTSSDGATRLLATAYIGIGNKLYIRGDGPGLSWDRGVPMQFVSIGKWGWSTQEATGPIRIKLFKNDEAPSLSGELTLEPGRHSELTALF